MVLRLARLKKLTSLFLKTKPYLLVVTRFLPLHKINLPGIKILTYHGICPDELFNEKWIPSHFVKLSEFGKQMEYISKYFKPISLKEAIRALKSRRFSSKMVVITFDDGYANNFHLALPVLQKLGIPATIFLTTRYIEKQDLFPFDKIRLLKYWGVKDISMTAYLNNPIIQLDYQLSQIWPKYKHLLTEKQWEILRPLTIEEIRKMKSTGLIDFGAHTHSHCILKNESRDTRKKEIAISVKRVKEITGQYEVSFSYPNGQVGDFDKEDKLCVKKFCYCAVSGIPGYNNYTTDLFELKRYCIGLHHSLGVFKLEISGIRQIALHLLGRRK